MTALVPLKILLIDMDPNRGRALEEKLSESGYAEILRAPDNLELAETVERTRPDLIIIDMALPDRDALEDIRAVSAAHPIVMFAGGDDPAVTLLLLECGGRVPCPHAGCHALTRLRGRAWHLQTCPSPRTGKSMAPEPAHQAQAPPALTGVVGRSDDPQEGRNEL